LFLSNEYLTHFTSSPSTVTFTLSKKSSRLTFAFGVAALLVKVNHLTNKGDVEAFNLNLAIS
jgi:hypothetical protein